MGYPEGDGASLGPPPAGRLLHQLRRSLPPDPDPQLRPTEVDARRPLPGDLRAGGPPGHDPSAEGPADREALPRPVDGPAVCCIHPRPRSGRPGILLLLQPAGSDGDPRLPPLDPSIDGNSPGSIDPGGARPGDRVRVPSGALSRQGPPSEPDVPQRLSGLLHGDRPPPLLRGGFWGSPPLWGPHPLQ